MINLSKKFIDLSNPSINVYSFRDDSHRVGSIEVIQFNSEDWDSIELNFPDMDTIDIWIKHLLWLKEKYKEEINEVNKYEQESLSGL